jgi:hypothetical protein
MIKKISIKVIFSFFGILASAHIAQGNEACISFYKKSGLASAIATSEKKERVKQYRTKVAELWNQEAFTVAADTLHKSWQETNAYQTRYKVMADENNTPIIDIKKYMRNAGIPESYLEFYRVNKDGAYEEDLKGFPNRWLSYSNRIKNEMGSKSILRQVIQLLTSNPKNADEAFSMVIDALQVTHQDWLDMNPWAKGSRPAHIRDLIPDLAITNASGPYKLFLAHMNSRDPLHQRIKDAFDKHIAGQQKKRIEEFANSNIESVYLNLITSKGSKVILDDNLEYFFDSKIPVKKIRESLPDSATMSENEKYYASILGPDIKKSLKYGGKIRLKAPSTVPGSGAKVFLVVDEGGAVIGALKIQHKDKGGLDELLSTLTVSKFVAENRSNVNIVKVVDYGLLSDNNYFSVIEPAKNRDLDGWLHAAQGTNAEVTILENAAQITAQLHNHAGNSPASKDTLDMFKGNSLYEVRKLNSFRNDKVIEESTIKMGVPVAIIRQVKQKVEAASASYEHGLDYYLNFFRPTTIHGDLHGGNVFFNSVSKRSTFIDYSTLTWTIANKGQPGTGDAANDLGRMLGHFFVEDLKANNYGPATNQRVEKFYHEYLKYSKIEVGSREETVLRRSLVFYLYRYFAIQASDVAGVKFRSSVLTQPQLLQKLYELWLNADQIFSLQAPAETDAA